MVIFPAIDILGGKAVRLLKGDYAKVTVYSDDPYSVAADFASKGCRAIHIVDLDGAREGSAVNMEIVRTIARIPGMTSEIGGGIRNMDTVCRYLDAGISRVILGTAALENPAFLDEAVSRFGERIAVGVDLKDGKVAMLLSTTFYIFNVIHSLRFKRKHRKEYDDIIFVRYNMAVAYLPKCLIKPGYRFISFIFPKPDVSIFVDIDPESAMRRILNRGEDLEMFETEEKLKKTREKMLILSSGWNIVDNNRGLEQTKESVEWILSELEKKE